MKAIISDKTQTVTKTLYLSKSKYSDDRLYIDDMGSSEYFRVIGEAEVTIEFKMYDLESMSEQAKEVERVKLAAEIAEKQKRLDELSNKG